MKSLYDILLEAKDDNLHEFIQYLNDCGKEGELKSPKRDFEKMLLTVNSLSKSIHWSMLLDSYGDIYCERNSLDEIEDEVDFENWLKEIPIDTIIKWTETNKNNCIYIERAITIPKFSNKDNFYRELKRLYDGHLGDCWSYMRDGAQAYWGNNNENEIILKGYVRPDDVDLDTTIEMNLVNMDEYELTVDYDAPIQLTEIITKRGKHKIFKGNLILQA